MTQTRVMVINMETTNPNKRQVTRQALLDAAVALVSEKGHDRISVQELTERARVATGTYYNYFNSKQEVYVAVAEAIQLRLKEQLDVLREPVHDPAMMVALTLKYYFRHAVDNQEWLLFTRCVGLTEMMLRPSAPQLQEDIERGVKAGRFRVDDVYFTQNLISGMIDHVTRQIQKGIMARNSIVYSVRSILQMLGLPEMVAKALTQTPLPPVAAPKHLSLNDQAPLATASVTPLKSRKVN